MISQKQKLNIALFLALLFHVCGIVGIVFTSYRQWFIDNTPLNLLLMAALVVLTQVEKNLRFWFFMLLCYCTGMLVEIIGVNTGHLFGHYSYGEVLGVQFMNVPLIIGVNWFTTIYCSGTIIHKLNEWLYNKMGTDFRPSFAVQIATFVFDAALLATIFDWILEPVAIALQYWKWIPEGEVPFFNFICWFLVSAVLLTVFRLLRFNKENQFALHLFIIQVLFFLILQTLS